MGALSGITILDLTQSLAGPYCTMMLADLGAKVIKIERPGSGDDSRSWGPPFINGESTYFMSINRGKKSLTLNLKDKRAIDIFKKLARNSDVVVENFRPGTVDRLGVGYNAIREENPRIVYCSISAFGQTGPQSSRPGYDLIMQGMAGLMSVTGEPGHAPVKAGFAVSDIGAGMFAAYGILAALLHRERTGTGQYLDTSLFEGQIAWTTFLAGTYFVTGKPPGRLGSAHHNIIPYQAFKTKDAYITIAVGNEGHWSEFCKVLGKEEWIEDPRFCSNQNRMENKELLIQLIHEVLMTRSGEEWLRALDAAGIPCGPIYSLDALFNDPQTAARDMIVGLRHAKAGTIKTTGMPVKFSKTPGEIRIPPPVLGEHTNEILASMGYCRDEITRLQQEGVV